MSLIAIKLKKYVKKLLILAFFLLDCVPNFYKIQEKCEKAVSKEPFVLKYCLDNFMPQEMCDKAANSCR